MKLERLLVMLTVLALVAAVPVTAADEEGDRKEDGHDAVEEDDEREVDAEDEREEEERDEEEDAGERDREVRVSTDGERAVLEYERKSGDLEGELAFEVYPRMDGLVKMEYEEETGTGKSAFKLDVHVRALLEYVDENGDGKFDPAADRVVTEHRASDLEWALGDLEDASFGGVPAKAFTATAPLGGNGTLTLRFLAAGAFANESGVSLRPTDLKFDVIITDYPFTGNDTALALDTRVKQKSESESKAPEEAAQSGGDVVVVRTAGLDLYFAWADVVTVDGVEHAVESTVTKLKQETETEVEDGEEKTESKSERTVFLSYPRGASIVHDPVVGVASTQSTVVAPVNTTPAAGLVLGLGAVAAVAVLHRSRRG